MDTMKAGGYYGPTNGAAPVVHTDGNRLVDQILADQQADLHVQAHRQRVLSPLPQAAAEPESAD